MSKSNRLKIDAVLEQLSGLIRRVHKRADTQDLFSPSALHAARMILGTLPLLEDEADEFSEIVANIYELTTAKKEHISLEATESLVQAAVVNGVDAVKTSRKSDFGRRLASAIDDLKTGLSQRVSPWTVYREVRGLAPDGLPFKVGRVEFVRADDSLSAAIRSSEVGNLFEPQAKGKIFGKVTVQAQDYNAANLLALKQLRLAADVVNFFADVLGGARQFMFLPGDGELTQTTSFLFHESRLTHVSSASSGPIAPMYLSYINEVRARRSGFDRASSLLCKENRNALESRILASIQWAGRAAVDQRLEEAFLLFVIALESLLLRKDMFGELRFRFALYGSHLVVKTFKDRKPIFDDLTSAYDRRSQIVHSGSTQVAITELRRIHAYVRDAILAVLLNPLFREMDEDQFDNWLKDCTLGAAEDST